MKPLRILFLALLFFAPVASWGQQTINGSIIRNGTTPLTALSSSGATTNQILQWSGSAWTPATLATGSGLTLTFAGGTFTLSLTTPVSVTNGGTGQSSYTDGQLLIGDSSTNGLDKATLTAGSGITVTNGHGSITIATSGGGSGNPTVNTVVGSGAAYTLTQSYANTGIAPITLTSGDTYQVTATAETNDVVAGEDLRILLYDSTDSEFLPGSEARAQSGLSFTGGPTGSYRQPLTATSIFTAPSNCTVQLWATDATAATNATITSYRTKLSAMQVSGSSSQTQQSNTIPFTTGLVSHYDFSADGTGTLSSQTDLGSANLTLTSGATKPTVVGGAWNGLNAVSFTSSTNPMATSSIPTTSLAWDLFAVCQVSAFSSNGGANIIFNGTAGTNGYSLLVGDVSGTGTAHTFEATIPGTFVAHDSGIVPSNGWVVLEFQRSGSTMTLFVDGASQGTSTATPVTPTGTFRIGNTCPIEVGEVLLYSSALSGANQTAIQNYLMSKWSL